MQNLISSVTWNHLIKKNKKIDSHTILSVISNEHPLFYFWKFNILDSIYIVLIMLYGLIFQIMISIFQSDLTSGYDILVTDKQIECLPYELELYNGNISETYEILTIYSKIYGIYRNWTNENDIIGSLIVNNINYKNNTNIHLYLEVPKLESEIIFYDKQCILNTININSNWLGCVSNNWNYIFYKNNTNYGIRYKILPQCFYIYQNEINICEYDNVYKSIIKTNNTLDHILQMFENSKYIKNDMNPLSILMSLSEKDYNDNNKVLLESINTILTYFSWSGNYEQTNGGRNIYSYEHKYYSKGNLNNIWYIIIVIPSLIMFTIKNINQYWIISIISRYKLCENNTKWIYVKDDNFMMLEQIK